MTVSFIVIGIIIFILGLTTPISFLYTLPISIVVLVFGLIRLLKK
jgi:hypothetical protein